MKKKGIFELSKAEEKEFRKMSLKINPTTDEVNTMSEYEWITTIYPRRIFHQAKLSQAVGE